jgi:prepilin peptidase CpaA
MVFDILILAVFPGLVVLAATSDMFTMTIPNRLCIALVAAFFPAALLSGMPLESIGWHVGCAVLALLVTMMLFASGVFGGGDAKLTAGIVLWLGPVLSLDFIILAALFGGALTAILVGMRQLPLYAMTEHMPWANRLLSKKVGIPYGIALSGAAMIVYSQSPWFAMAIAS